MILGLPKPVTWTHGFFAAIDNTVYAPAPKGTKSIMKVYHNLRLFNAMPAFHVSRFLMLVLSDSLPVTNCPHHTGFLHNVLHRDRLSWFEILSGRDVICGSFHEDFSD